MAVKKKKFNFNILLKIIIILLLLAIYFVWNLKLLNNKDIIIVTIITTISIIFLKILSKIKITRKFAFFLSFITIIMLTIINFFLFKTNDFLVNLNNSHQDEYFVITLSSKKYHSLNSLENKNIGITTDNDELMEYLNKYTFLSIKEYSDNDTLLDDLFNEKIDGAIISSSYIDLYKEENPELIEKINIIDKIRVNNKKNVDTKKVDVDDKPFILYISGIDTYQEITSSNRSDVNMLLVVNSKKREILLVNIPRDYYVIIPKFKSHDKLTHTGIYGVDNSIATINNLLDIDINYYTRVNFSFLVSLVNTLDGIDVNSAYSFNTENYHFNSGNIHLGGEGALEFVRERKSLPDGDISRGINQQAVIIGIFNKLKNKNTLLKYNKIINSLNGNFETNITSEEISVLVKDTIKNNNWHINSIYLTGTDKMEYTYSYQRQKLYVMIPDQDSITIAKEEINKILNNE